ncbi:hypothetical protein RRG08_062882 [Elysia crispata]|uniref:Uncharacterized protein n=1 Tax=Elysia crispata TaxID=231223 RepID=A0AAE1B894_9GAST|nr:hypothetical protein RRG08_062882 [Elysia crispata]
MKRAMSPPPTACDPKKRFVYKSVDFRPNSVHWFVCTPPSMIAKAMDHMRALPQAGAVTQLTGNLPRPVTEIADCILNASVDSRAIAADVANYPIRLSGGSSPHPV